MTAKGDFFPARINMWFANCKYAADVNNNGVGRIDIPAPDAADSDGILAGSSIATALDTSDFASTYSDDVMSKFGRNVTAVASGASTAKVDVYGTDYLGQPIKEELTLNGTTAVAGKKAFKRVTKITSGTTAGTTINVGWGDVFGLPYKLLDMYTELVDGAEPSSAGTIVKGTDTTQTATTGDPRGTYAPDSGNASDGDTPYSIVGLFDTSNLLGVKHYAG